MAEIQLPAGPAMDITLAAPLVTTKLYVPPTRPNLVRRERLTGRLNEGLDHKLTLIAAPAGFGKTTLLSEWIQLRTNGSSRRAPVGWLSLDEGDNDPARFWSYFIAALQTVRERCGATALALLHAPQPPAITSLLATLINEIAATPDHLALVLDDYHLIEAQAIHRALAYLLEHLPPQMHLIISSRAELPLALARLRARGQLVELRADDLRFTPEEAGVFLEQLLGPALSAEDVATLAARTEGWVAGLQLAVLSLQDREDTGRFIQAFSGDDRYILEYLLEEVLQRQSEGVQRFLLETSILDRLCGPLCDAVTGGGGSQAMLARLEAANLFTVALDTRHRCTGEPATGTNRMGCRPGRSLTPWLQATMSALRA
jgi:LuxR family maltose regulon positive regulatory protein